MFSAIARMRQAKADRKMMAGLRVRLHSFQELLKAEDITFKIRLGSRIRRQLEHRFGDETVARLNSDEDLMRESKLFDCFSFEKLFEISDKLSGGKATHQIKNDDYAPPASLMLLAGSLKAKAIELRSADHEIIQEAREHAALHYFHIQNLLRIVRGEPVVDDR
jgi:hypothetical protein